MREENEEVGLLKRLASEFKSNSNFESSAQLVKWLKEKLTKSQDRNERALIKRLINEEVLFGEKDDWGKYSPELVLYARLLEYLDTNWG